MIIRHAGKASQVNNLQFKSQVNNLQVKSQVNNLQFKSKVNNLKVKSQVNNLQVKSQVNNLQVKSRVIYLNSKSSKKKASVTRVNESGRPTNRLEYGETGASCIRGQVVTEAFYEKRAHLSWTVVG